MLSHCMTRPGNIPAARTGIKPWIFRSGGHSANEELSERCLAVVTALVLTLGHHEKKSVCTSLHPTLSKKSKTEDISLGKKDRQID